MKISFFHLPSTRLDISKTKSTEIRFSLEGFRKDDDLTVDLYPIENPAHPDRHVGYWVFSPREDGRYRLSVDLNGIEEGSIRLKRDDTDIHCVSFWINPDRFVEPQIDFQIVARRKGKIIKMVHLILTLKAAEELEKFYRREGGGVYKIDTLNLAFHKRRLTVLGRLFKKYIKYESRILDAGSGMSVFTMIDIPVSARVFCLDIDFKPKPEKRKNFYHVLGNAETPPFKERSFDVVYSGEIIEHLLNPHVALQAWRDALKDNGHLIVTTPNLKRLINRARRHELPLSKEHVNEMSLDDAVALLKKTGFDILKKRGIYLELFLTWWRRDHVTDLFQTAFNKKWAAPAIRWLMALGYRFPSYALDMVIVARKSQEVMDP